MSLKKIIHTLLAWLSMVGLTIHEETSETLWKFLEVKADFNNYN